MKKLTSAITTLAVCGGLLGGVSTAYADHQPQPSPFEMWLFDQSRTDHVDLDADGNFRDGGTLYIFRGNITGDIDSGPSQIINLATVPPVGTTNLGERPHIGGTNFGKTHVALSYFATQAPSGGIDILRITDRKVVASYRNMGALHMPGPSPDDKQMAGVSIGQQLLHLFSTDYITETFGPLNTYNLATQVFPGVGNPGGQTLPALLGTTTAAPICSNYTFDSKHLFVTFQQGGLAIFNVQDITNPKLTEVYPVNYVDAGTGTHGIPAEGCGLIQHRDLRRMYTFSGVASGSSAFFGNAEYTHVWNMRTVGDGVLNDLTKTIDMGLSAATGGTDSWGDLHGPNFVFLGRYLWVVVRIDSTVKVIDTLNDTLVNTFSLAGPYASNPTPDVLERSPINPFRLWVTYRGYCPLSGPTRFVDRAGEPNCPSVTNEVPVSGRNPGLVWLRVNPDGKSGSAVHHFSTNNLVSTYVVGMPLGRFFNITDPHAG